MKLGSDLLLGAWVLGLNILPLLLTISDGASQIIHLQKRECKEKASHQVDPQKC